MGEFQLAQANITTGRWRLDHPRLQGFVDRAGPVNALAHRAAGFAWRPEAEDVLPELRRLGVDPWRDAFNMSVWESVEALWEFTFRGGHLEALQHKAKWFAAGSARDVLWWVPAGHRPTVEEGLTKLDLIEREGPAPGGFTFRQRFPPPSAVGGGAPAVEPVAEPVQRVAAPDADGHDVAGQR